MKGSTYKLQTPVGSAFITINEEAGTGMPMEVFINVGKAGSDVAAMAEALGRTISTALRFAGQVNPKERAREIAHQLSGIGGRRTVGFGHNKIRSLPDAVSVALSKHYGFNINGNLHFLETTPGVVGAIAAANGSASPKNGVELTPAGIVDPTAASTMPEVVSGANDQNIPQEETVEMEKMGDICPSCGLSSFVYQEGCAKCYSCGYSEC
jgi:ribonucleoside-diphosphate reductase alpha chain